MSIFSIYQKFLHFQSTTCVQNIFLKCTTLTCAVFKDSKLRWLFKAFLRYNRWDRIHTIGPAWHARIRTSLGVLITGSLGTDNVPLHRYHNGPIWISFLPSCYSCVQHSFLRLKTFLGCLYFCIPHFIFRLWGILRISQKYIKRLQLHSFLTNVTTAKLRKHMHNVKVTPDR